MNFSFNEDQNAIKESIARFSEAVLAPGYKKRDQTGIIERELIAQLGDMGFLGVELPEVYGGSNLDCITSGIIIEEISRHDFNLGYIPLLTSLNGQIIASHATPELASEWLPQIVAGKKIVCIALTEHGGGSDAANLKMKAERQGDHYILNGEKTSISMADQADVAVVFARTGTQESRAHGISAFLVPMNLPGITTTRFEDSGQRCIGRGSIFFDQVKIPASHLLGEENKGFKQVMQGFDYSRALIGLQCLAVAQQSLDETWQWLTEREAFGQKLSAFQGLTHPLAELQTYVQAARLQCYYALWLKDNHLPHNAEAAMNKWWGPKLAFDVVKQCMLAHGHTGWGEDLPFAQRLRDVLGLQIGDGTAQIMKNIIAREFNPA
ncbi:cyclohexanecarboxyl-CoA dehydrogenase [Marinospirillum alkaliphilum]|uniref:Cyclohexanecarboxyl-CoA dehydrogenase n=1 Tax=Marinospirillum alkaliphilum DSM 21637 TaxID=1122209 RepID=A0A1K1VL98_9GAMM|nr:cyclohexanecarboxyl-CoA dehydrogenase [Marinospirillum alkaliphilum]SFX25874.1 cyclohexanecarboxyl-CoA dehydrogenase [Marinospirillum alkaliphilum DSM 21637]